MEFTESQDIQWYRHVIEFCLPYLEKLQSDTQWISSYFHSNPNLTLPLVQEYGIDKLKSNFHGIGICLNKYFDVKWYYDNKDKSYVSGNPNKNYFWRLYSLLDRPDLKLEWIEIILEQYRTLRRPRQMPWDNQQKIWSHPNVTLEWLRKLSLFRINWNSLSEHPNMTLEWLTEFPDKKWNYFKLSSHPNLTLDWIHQFPQKSWSYSAIARNPNFRLDWIPYLNKCCIWKHNGIHQNPNLCLDWIKAFPDEKWIWGNTGISNNVNVTLDWLKQFPDKPWSWENLSRHPNFEWQWFLQFPDKEWSWRLIVQHSNIGIPEIKYILVNKKMHPTYLVRMACHNPNFDIIWIPMLGRSFYDGTLTQKEWDTLCQAPQLQLSWLRTVLNGGWNWQLLSQHPNFQIEWLETFPWQSWDMNLLSKHPNITPDWIQKHPKLKWCSFNLSNQDFWTFELIDWCFQNHPHLIHYFIWKNPFPAEKKRFANKIFAVQKIENWWLQCLYNPKYWKCRQKREADLLSLHDSF